MEIDSEKLIGLGNSRRRPSSHRRHRSELHPLITLPIEALNFLPLVLTAKARQEAQSLTLTRQILEIPQLPSAFDGITLAFLTDFHCGPLTPPRFLEQVVLETNRLKPDLVLLGGDYITRGALFMRPIGEILGRLRAPFGVYGVLGNHDYWNEPDAVRVTLKEAGIVDVTNSGHWVKVDGNRIRIAGVGDLWEDKPDLHSALSGVKASESAILLSHNPDFAVGLADKRVKLVLSGHTHGGQIRLPGIGPLITNSKYGQRLAGGLIAFESFTLYVSRGLGTVLIPFRYKCPPEVVLLTLRPRL